MKIIIINGLYRSGKTFIQKLLDVHKDITMISHGIVSFFKVLEMIYFKDKNYTITERPFCLEFLGNNIEYKNIINDTFFDEKNISYLLKKIQKDIANDLSLGGDKTRPGDELVLEIKKILTPGKAKDIFELICSAISKYRKINDSVYVGFSEQNLEQFIEPLILGFGDKIKIIQIIRDPRAIFTSRNYGSYVEKKGGGKIHPMLLVGRVWRTSVNYKWYLCANYSDNFYPLYYEKLMSQPENELKNIYAFLGIKFSEDLMDISKLKNDDGKKWINNSSFQGVKGFDVETIDRWKKILPDDDLAAFEYICSYEMIREGYKTLTSVDRQFESFLTFKENVNRIKKWTYKYNLLFDNIEKEKEIFRHYYLNHFTTNEI